MPNDDKFLNIMDKLSDIGERSARMEVEQSHMKDDLEEIKSQDIIQNRLLAEHIKGVESTNARLDNEILIRKSIEHAQNELKSKVEKLEEPNKFLSLLKQYIVYIAVVGAGIVAIRKWFQP